MRIKWNPLLSKNRINIKTPENSFIHHENSTIEYFTKIDGQTAGETQIHNTHAGFLPS